MIIAIKSLKRERERIRAGGGESARAVGGKGPVGGVFSGIMGAACDVGVDAVSKVQLAAVAKTAMRLA
jgi:hypothetical protein